MYARGKINQDPQSGPTTPNNHQEKMYKWSRTSTLLVIRKTLNILKYHFLLTRLAKPQRADTLLAGGTVGTSYPIQCHERAQWPSPSWRALQSTVIFSSPTSGNQSLGSPVQEQGDVTFIPHSTVRNSKRLGVTETFCTGDLVHGTLHKENN